MDSDARLTLRPRSSSRAAGCAFVVFGAIFGPSGLTTNHTLIAVFTGLYGLFIALIGVSIVIARLECDRTGLTYRGLRTVRFSASDVSSVSVKSIAGYAYRRLRIDVNRKNGRPLKLTRFQRGDNAKNRATAEADADAIRQALGLDAVG
jgi:hypothetical protein